MRFRFRSFLFSGMLLAASSSAAGSPGPRLPEAGLPAVSRSEPLRVRFYDPYRLLSSEAHDVARKRGGPRLRSERDRASFRRPRRPRRDSGDPLSRASGPLGRRPRGHRSCDRSARRATVHLPVAGGPPNGPLGLPLARRQGAPANGEAFHAPLAGIAVPAAGCRPRPRPGPRAGSHHRARVPPHEARPDGGTAEPPDVDGAGNRIRRPGHAPPAARRRAGWPLPKPAEDIPRPSPAVWRAGPAAGSTLSTRLEFAYEAAESALAADPGARRPGGRRPRDRPVPGRPVPRRSGWNRSTPRASIRWSYASSRS